MPAKISNKMEPTRAKAQGSFRAECPSGHTHPRPEGRDFRPRGIKLWLPVLVCMGIIFYASSLPGSDIPSLFPFQDIAFHMSIYAMLAYFFARALKKSYAHLTLKNVIFFTIIFGVIYGITDEFHQAFVPYRSVSGFDLFIDSIGSLIGSLIYR